MNEKLQQVLAELPTIQERAENATAGTWEYIRDQKHRGDLGKIVGEYTVCEFGNKTTYNNLCGVAPEDNDLVFILKAREDVLKLCDALQAAIEEIERQREAWHEMLEAKNYWYELYEECCLANEAVIERLQAKITHLETIEKHYYSILEEGTVIAEGTDE